MSSHSPLDPALLDLYLVGTCSPDERAIVSRWLQADPRAEALVGALRRLDEGQSGLHDERAEQALRAKIQNRVREVAGKSKPRSGFRWKGWMGASAALVLLIAFVFAYRSPLPSSGSASRTYTTARAQHASMTLSDGTRVTLAPETQLTVASGFARDSRTVILSGEAYFEVPQHSSAPFIVQTGPVSTRVLGTAFSVRRYETDPQVRVAVASGKVNAGNARASITLTAGKAAQVTDSTATEIANVQPSVEWARGRLVFDEARVPELLTSLGRWYGYEFRLQDSTLATRNVSAAFTISDPQEMMVVLRGLLAVDMTVHGNVVTLTPRRSSHDGRAVPARHKQDFTPLREVGR